MNQQNQPNEPERSFESLDFYQDSLKLLKASYKLAEDLPTYERYNLSDQLRRASCSILLNIAEGYGRYHYLERLRFLYIARGSLSETLSAFVIAQNLDYCNETQLNWSRELKIKIEKNLNGYCRFIKKQKQGGTEYGNQYLK
jgi:four helix bundle protein